MPHTPLKAWLNSLFCLSLLLFPCPLPLTQFLLFHKHTALMGLEGLWGYAISSHINNPTAIHNMRAFFPLSRFPPMYIFTPQKQNRFLGSNQRAPTFLSFCGNDNIVFHEALSSFPGNSLHTIWFGLLFWSEAVQREQV